MGEAFRDPLFWLFPVGGTIVSMLAFLLIAVPLTWLAWRDPSALRIYRIQRRRPSDPRRMVRKAVLVWLLNNLLLFALIVASWPLLRLAGVHAGPLPAWWVVVLQVLFFVYLDDALYYGMHRLMHRNRTLWRHVHRWHHRTKTPWAIGAHDMHPLEYVATAGLMLVGPLVLGSHVLTVWIWVALRQAEAAEGHSGYDFPLAINRLIPFSHGAAHHDFHHARVNGNFAGFLPHMDRWMGTLAKGYSDYRDRRRG